MQKVKATQGEESENEFEMNTTKKRTGNLEIK